MYLASVLILTIGTSFAQGVQEPIIPYAYPNNGLASLNATRLGLCMALVNRGYGSKIKFDKNAIKCRAFARPLPDSRSWRDNPPKRDLSYERGLFSVYIVAHDRVCDFQTGKEDTLKEWVLSQPDNSIDPLSIYRKSLEIHNGDIWAAVVSIHQLLRNNARWWNTWQYEYDSSNSNQKLFFDKFIDIRGDLRELGGLNNGDHAGTWYRLWAAMLVRLNLSKADLFEQQRFDKDCSCIVGNVSEGRRMVGYIANGWAETLVGADGALHGLFDDKDNRKARINRAGAVAAASMLNAWTDPRLLNGPDVTEEACDRRNYLSE